MEFYVFGVGTPHTRAPHLLLIQPTGLYSVRLNRFMFASRSHRGHAGSALVFPPSGFESPKIRFQSPKHGEKFAHVRKKQYLCNVKQPTTND